MNFEYKGIKGTSYTSGIIDALDIEEATFKLKQEKIIVTQIIKSKDNKKIQKNQSGLLDIFKGSKIPTKEILIFTKQLSTMIKAGLPILSVLNMLEEQTIKKNLKDLVISIKKDVESGSPLSDAFSKFPKIFDSIYINLVKAGEASGNMDLFFEKIVTSLEKREKIKRAIKSALFYPVTLLIIALSVTVFMLIKVVPIFVEMYDGMGVTLPSATKTIMSISAFIRSPTGGGFVLIIGILSIFLIRYLKEKFYPFRFKIHTLYFKLPLFGDLILKSILARIAIVLGNLTSAGVSLIESTEIAKSITTNEVIILAFENIKKGVFSGETLSSLFAKEKIFPQTFSQLVTVGEQTGNLEGMFGSIGTYYEEEFDSSVSNLSSLIEPITISLMGILIGGLMIALYQPIFSIGEVVS